MKYILIIFTALFILSLPVSGQEKSKQKEKSKTQKHGLKDEEDEEEDPFPLKRFEYGINLGAYFPNKYSANFYSGVPSNINTVNYVLQNEYWLREIKQLLGVSEMDPVYVDGYPLDMHYNIALTGGVFLRVNFDKKNGVFLQANYTQLRAADALTLYAPNYTPTYNDDIRLEQVIGREGRVMIDLGYQRSFPMKSRISLFIQAAATMCYTQMLESLFVVEGKPYNMVNIYTSPYQQGYSNQTVDVYQNAFGFGGTLGFGAGIPLTDMFGIEPGFSVQYYPTNLELYTEFRPSFSLYLRILIHSATEEE